MCVATRSCSTAASNSYVQPTPRVRSRARVVFTVQCDGHVITSDERTELCCGGIKNDRGRSDLTVIAARSPNDVKPKPRQQGVMTVFGLPRTNRSLCSLNHKPLNCITTSISTTDFLYREHYVLIRVQPHSPCVSLPNLRLVPSPLQQHYIPTSFSLRDHHHRPGRQTSTSLPS